MEPCPKMASTLYQEQFLKTHFFFFWSKNSNFEKFGPYDFVQIYPACGPNTYQIMYGETLDFQCQH